ncbi:peroxiredoxin [candidate division KSB1 bacterium]
MGNELKIGDKAPDFCLPDQDGKNVCLKDFAGKYFVLYFYPKDNTSGCTLEAKDFSDNINKFSGKNITVIGVSPDSVSSHLKFISKQNLKIVLLSDENKNVIQKYGAWKLKKMYGREYYGVDRSTFIIGPDSRIVFKQNGVKVAGHVGEILKQLGELISD